MAFLREKHNHISNVLCGIDRGFLNHAGCYFAGGTAIAMAFGEHRTSFDIDFLASFDAFNLIKQRIHSCGMTSFTNEVSVIGDVIISRGMIKAILQYQNEQPIKFEIILEDNMPLNPVVGLIGKLPEVLTVSPSVMVAQKLMAFSDRGMDISVHHRDYWDLCVLAESLSQEIFSKGAMIANDIYSQGMIEDCFLRGHKDAQKHKERDFHHLGINNEPYFSNAEDKLLSFFKYTTPFINQLFSEVDRLLENKESSQEIQQKLMSYIEGLYHKGDRGDLYVSLCEAHNKIEKAFDQSFSRR